MWANSPFSYEAERERIEKIRAERGRRRPPSRYIYQLKFQHVLLPAKIYQVLKYQSEVNIDKIRAKEDVEDPNQGINQSIKYCHLQKYTND